MYHDTEPFSTLYTISSAGFNSQGECLFHSFELPGA